MLVHRVTNQLERLVVHRPSRIRVVTARRPVDEIELPQVGVVLGASRTCDVVIDDPTVSGRHASIVPADGGFDVKDLGSRNGTWLDGVALTQAMVPVGTMLRLGSVLVQLLPAEESVEMEPSEASSFGALVGQSRVMRQVYATLERASASTAPVLLLGESGTGKELAARAIHDHGPRKNGPFVVFDCGAAGESLVESELFGFKRGAFTGAFADRPGAMALADQGTLFLDEIGDLPLALQPKLLRLLERGEVTPLGARKSERYDVRFVSATHRDLWAEVGAATFRGDLFYRLAVVEVHLPPLRSHPEDIAALVAAFLRANGAHADGITGPSLDRLMRYAWPGNVRELRNAVTRGVVLSPPGSRFEDMPIFLRSAASTADEPLARADVPYHVAKDAVLARFERDYLTDLLRRSGDNLSQAARTAGVERKHLYKVLARAGLLPRTRSEPAEPDEDG
jgi:DNA-binding NtrC family response regulator